MSDEQSTSNPNDILDSVKNVKLCAVRAVGEANALPMRHESYELYASFPVYANLMLEQQRRITAILREVLRNAGCRIPIPVKIDDLDELLDRIVEANDSICERASILLDLLQKARRMEEVVVPQQIIDAESTASSEQTLFERQGRYVALLRRLPGYKDKLLSPAIDTAAPLLTSKEKPQVVYGIEVDNSFAEFKPKLKKKYHAMEICEKNLQIIDNSDDGTDSIIWRSDQGTNLHPYHKELNHFKIPARQLIAGIIEPLKTLSDTELVYVDMVEKLKSLRDILNKEQEFSVDLEHNAQRSFLGLTCLLQISTREVDYIIDPFPLWKDMHILNEPFTDPNILKVFHGADSDIVWLQRDFGIYVVNMFDTYKAMRMLNYSKFSYQHLVQNCCNHTLDKKFQKADWRLRPLTNAHKTYARSDTHYLLHCYDQLRKKLLDQGNNLLEVVYNESVQTCLTVYNKPVFESDGYEKLLVGRKPLNSRQQFALAALWKWRDERARTDDESVQYVLPCHMMLQISEVLPREMQGILACCSPVPKHVKQELHALHQIINTARDQPLVKRSVNAPNIGSLTLEGVTSQLNKMNAVKAMLRCHLDFSSTKYNEEIRDIVTQDVDRAICEGGVASKSCDGLFATELYIIGEDNEKEDERLTKVMEKLQDWATPYECYRIALIEQNSKAESKSKEKEKNATKNEQSASGEKKLWSHLDSATNKLQFTEEKVTASELQMESEQRRNAEGEMNIYEEMTLTKTELKRKRKREAGEISIATTQEGSERQKKDAKVVEKRGRKSNWTDAAESCERVDYGAFDPDIFNKKAVSISDTYDPFKRCKKSKSQRGRRMMQRGRKLDRDR